MRCCGETYRTWRDFGASLLGLFLRFSGYFRRCFYFSKRTCLRRRKTHFSLDRNQTLLGHPKKAGFFVPEKDNNHFSDLNPGVWRRPLLTPRCKSSTQCCKRAPMCCQVIPKVRETQRMRGSFNDV